MHLLCIGVCRSLWKRLLSVTGNTIHCAWDTWWSHVAKRGRLGGRYDRRKEKANIWGKSKYRGFGWKQALKLQRLEELSSHVLTMNFLVLSKFGYLPGYVFFFLLCKSSVDLKMGFAANHLLLVRILPKWIMKYLLVNKQGQRAPEISQFKPELQLFFPILNVNLLCFFLKKSNMKILFW